MTLHIKNSTDPARLHVHDKTDMPNLDFLTLYILIFLNSLSVTAVWAGFCYIYRPHVVAQHWLAATILALVGGIVLATQGNAGALVPAVLGNVIIIFGFAQFWIGLRKFYNRKGGQLWALGFTIIAAAFMIALHDSGRGRAIVYASGQSIVMLACLFELLRNRAPGIGAIIAAVAFAVALLGQILVITTNGAVIYGALDFQTYYTFASYALLCTVFSATVWNLGFALMAVDSLHRSLKSLSERDELTGLANRRAFRKHFEQLRAQTQTTHCLILIDLDDFKLVNDSFGHFVGDTALQHFASLLPDCARADDMVARLGGDEFALLLPDTSLADAKTIAQRVRKKVASSPLVTPEGEITLSCSIGVASSTEAKALDKRLFSLTDARLYEDKNASQTRHLPSNEDQVQPV